MLYHPQYHTIINISLSSTAVGTANRLLNYRIKKKTKPNNNTLIPCPAICPISFSSENKAFYQCHGSYALFPIFVRYMHNPHKKEKTEFKKF